MAQVLPHFVVSGTDPRETNDIFVTLFSRVLTRIPPRPSRLTQETPFETPLEGLLPSQDGLDWPGICHIFGGETLTKM